jgi:hypothetical protein
LVNEEKYAKKSRQSGERRAVKPAKPLHPEPWTIKSADRFVVLDDVVTGSRGETRRTGHERREQELEENPGNGRIKKGLEMAFLGAWAPEEEQAARRSREDEERSRCISPRRWPKWTLWQTQGRVHKGERVEKCVDREVSSQRRIWGYEPSTMLNQFIRIRGSRYNDLYPPFPHACTLRSVPRRLAFSLVVLTQSES